MVPSTYYLERRCEERREGRKEKGEKGGGGSRRGPAWLVSETWSGRLPSHRRSPWAGGRMLLWKLLELRPPPWVALRCRTGSRVSSRPLHLLIHLVGFAGGNGEPPALSTPWVSCFVYTPALKKNGSYFRVIS